MAPRCVFATCRQNAGQRCDGIDFLTPPPIEIEGKSQSDSVAGPAHRVP